MGRTLFTLDPTYILIDEDLNPIFADVSSNRKLNYGESTSTIDNFHISKSFIPPEMQKENEKFSLAKMDSFQLGILALALLCTGTSPFLVNNEKDPYYKMVFQR